MAERWFEDKDLEALAAMIAADYAEVPKWRRQAAAYRRLAELGERQRAKITGHLQRAMDHWSSRATTVVRGKGHGIAESLERGLNTAYGNARSLEAIADEIESAKIRMDEIQAEWSDVKNAYEKDPTIFQKGAIEGVSSYQEAKAAIDRAARERMHTMSVETTQAWHTDMHIPGQYTGPTRAKLPRDPVQPFSGSGSGGGQDTTYPFTYRPPAPPPTGMTTPPDPGGHVPPPTNDPSLEFPTPTPGGSPVITGPGAPPVGGPAPVPAPGFQPSTPPVNPGLFRPGMGVPTAPRPGMPTVPGQRPGAMPGQRATQPVLGQRAGAATTKATPPRAVADKGVIRNPKQANASTSPAPRQRATRRSDEDETFRDGPQTDELFEGLSLDAVADVVRPEPAPPRVRRRDVGPVLRRRFGR